MRISIRLIVAAMLALTILAVSRAEAHFGTLIPSDDIVSSDDPKEVGLTIQFIHPFEMHFMEMDRPEAFGLLFKGQSHDLIDLLKAAKGKAADQKEDFTFWTADYRIRRPGDYTFYVKPVPYWEPAEDVFIVHYTKVCVHALGLEQGWDQPLGLETEIVPLTRPYGLWTGNLFTGQVLLKGQPVPFAEVEVEYLNASPGNPHIVQAPADAYITQVVKADQNGIFSYAMPRAGWWGFAALSEANWTLQHDGKEKGVEIGAVYWVCTRDMK